MEPSITLAAFCRHHRIESAFLLHLSEHGLLSLQQQGDETLLAADDLPVAERLVRLHYDLDINLEGLEVIQHLLQRLEETQEELRTLRNRLRFYEGA